MFLKNRFKFIMFILLLSEYISAEEDIKVKNTSFEEIQQLEKDFHEQGVKLREILKDRRSRASSTFIKQAVGQAGFVISALGLSFNLPALKSSLNDRGDLPKLFFAYALGLVASATTLWMTNADQVNEAQRLTEIEDTLVDLQNKICEKRGIKNYGLLKSAIEAKRLSEKNDYRKKVWELLTIAGIGGVVYVYTDRYYAAKPKISTANLLGQFAFHGLLSCSLGSLIVLNKFVAEDKNDAFDNFISTELACSKFQGMLDDSDRCAHFWKSAAGEWQSKAEDWEKALVGLQRDGNPRGATRWDVGKWTFIFQKHT